jgi:methylenetetrahydrofolate reductase (NADPH)
MHLKKILESDRAVISFELFPPKTPKGEANLYRHVKKLMAFDPAFITCTYGAGGSTQSKTLEIISKVKQDFQIPVASHLTLVGSTVDDLRRYLNSAKEQSVDFIVALRGDPPEGEHEFRQTAGGLRYANELVELINAEFSNFGVIVAGYPEKHREAPSLDVDLDNLKRKVDAGADVIVTQLFYDNSDFFRFQELCEKKGINVPVIPGILPVTSLQQIQRITSLCGAKLPESFVSRLGEKESSDWQFKVGLEQAIEQTAELLATGVKGIHFYVLNRSDATAKILEDLDLNCRVTGSEQADQKTEFN